MNQRTSPHVGFHLHSAVIFALQIEGTGEEKTNERAGGNGGKGGRESEDANLMQEKDALDVDLSLLL